MIAAYKRPKNLWQGIFIMLGVAVCLSVSSLVWLGMQDGDGARSAKFGSAHSPAITKMLKQFRQATPTEIAWLTKADASPATLLPQPVYIAAEINITLVPTDRPFTLVLPPGYKWTAGPLGRVHLIIPEYWDGRSTQIAQFPDYLCALQELQRLTGDCLDPLSNASMGQELTLRPATVAEKGQLPKPNEETSVLAATGSGALPQVYTMNEPVVILGPGVQATGGPLGLRRLYVSGPPVTYVRDEFCWAGHKAPFLAADPVVFAPSDSPQHEAAMTCRSFNE